MSNFLAVATVSATLRSMVEEAARVALSGVEPTVTTGRPDSLASNNGSPTTGVTVFLYQVTPNAHWSTGDLPTRRGDGSLIQPPRAALDLSYLLTFFGSETSRQPERMLGSVISRLQTEPLLSRERIRQVIATDDDLAESDLDQQVDLVRFVPVSLDLEALAKLWSVFSETAYRLSVVYRGSVVLIEPEVLPQPTLPVRRPLIYVDPFRLPVIERAVGENANGDPDPEAPIVPGGILVLEGRNLRREEERPGPVSELVTRVLLGEEMAQPDPGDVGPTRIRIALGEPPFPPGTLRAGVRGARVAHLRVLGDPPAEHRGVESNVEAFVLRPVLRRDGGGNLEITIEEPAPMPPPPPDEDPPPAERFLMVTVDPIVGGEQQAVLLLNRPGDSYALPALARGEDPHEVRFSITGVAPETYMVRVRVDGAESPLEVDGDGLYDGPTFTIPEPPP